MQIPTKTGRGRRYLNQPPTGFVSRGIAESVAEIGELRERVYDQIEDLPAEGLNYVAPDSQLSVGWLTVHLIVAELHWVGRICDEAPAESLMASSDLANYTQYGDPLKPVSDAATLIELARRSFAEFSIPKLQSATSLGDPTTDAPLATAGHVLKHLAWHWTYHSGHIGLVRLQWGGEYEWRFD